MVPRIAASLDLDRVVGCENCILHGKLEKNLHGVAREIHQKGQREASMQVKEKFVRAEASS